MPKALQLIATFLVPIFLSGFGFSQNAMSAPDKPDVIDDAYKLCQAFERTGQTTECSVHGYGGTVDVTIDTNGEEARKICIGAANMLAKQTVNFRVERRWKLRIFSPYSGKRPIATCALH